MAPNDRFNSFRRRKIQKQVRKELPFLLQYGNSVAGMASLILAGVLRFQTTTIKDMDKLLRKQDALITGQQQQIKEYQAQVLRLTEIDSVLLVNSQQMNKQILAINNQTDYVKLSTAPQLNYTDIGLDSVSPTKSRMTVIVKNFGGRPMENIYAETFLFLKDGQKYVPVFSNGNRGKEDTRTVLKPGDSKTVVAVIDGPKQIMDLYRREGYLIVRFQYFDEVLKQTEKPKPFMFQFFKNESNREAYRELYVNEVNDILSKASL